MTPKNYLDRYTNLKFPDPFSLLPVPAGLTNYGSGYKDGESKRMGDGHAKPSEVQKEALLFTNALRMAHHGNAYTKCGPYFYFDQRPLALISPLEIFYASSISRTFNGKGSPDEIIDTLRIAVAIGRIGTARDANGQLPAQPNAQAYVKRFVTLDCNGFAGAFFGVDGDVLISTFAVPSRRRVELKDIKVGDAVITHCPQPPYEHIGVIDDFKIMIDSGDKIRALVTVAEWGEPGGEERHYSKDKVHIIERKEQSFGLGWETTSNSKNWFGRKTFRYIFEPPGFNDPLGWLY